MAVSRAVCKLSINFLKLPFFKEGSLFAPSLAVLAVRGVKSGLLAHGAAKYELPPDLIKPQLGKAVRAGDPVPRLCLFRYVYFPFAYVALKHHNRRYYSKKMSKFPPKFDDIYIEGNNGKNTLELTV